MNFQFYLEKLFDSGDFQKFKLENPTAFLCSGFFSIDKKGNDNQQHLDYFIPESEKLFSFKFIGGNLELVPVQDFKLESDNFKPEKINDNYDFDFSEIEELIIQKIAEEGIKKQVEKILLSLQSKSGKDFLIGTVFTSNLGMLKIAIDLNEKEITEFQKRSFFDMIRVVKKGD